LGQGGARHGVSGEAQAHRGGEDHGQSEARRFRTQDDRHAEGQLTLKYYWYSENCNVSSKGRHSVYADPDPAFSQVPIRICKCSVF
jgi:hypothetical protein